MRWLFALLIAAPVHAGELSDALFVPPPPEGSYRHVLDGKDEALDLRPEAGRIALLRDGQPITDFAAGSGDPLLIWFLESVTHRMAEATGGSPFYIRSRIRDALVAAPLDLPVTPFAEDANRAQMGDFANLALRFVFDGPRLILLSAEAGTYRETIMQKEN